MELWWEGGGHEGSRAGVQIRWHTVRGLPEEDDRVAVSFRMTDTGRPAEEVPLVPVSRTGREDAEQIRLRVHRLPGDRVWYLLLVQAYFEQGGGKRKQGMVSQGSGDIGLESQDKQ